MVPMTRWVQRLLIANVVMSLIAPPTSALFRQLWFYPPMAIYQPWTIVTYMFLHGGFGHLFFNMIGLYFFGPRLEERLGFKGFLGLYFVSGIGGAALQTVFASAAPMVGASGAIYGLLLGYALYWPRERILVMFVLPMEIWLAVTLYVAYSLYAGMGNLAGGIAHFAHLGGVGFGFAFLKFFDWKRGSAKRAFKKKLKPDAPSPGFRGNRVALARWEGISVQSLHELNREEVERLLAKARDEGSSSLTDSERDFMNRMSGG